MSTTSNRYSPKENNETPLMSQYNNIKTKYPDAILLFRVGDFYETFGKDAITTSAILNIVLTSRNNGGAALELAGFPYHSLDTYLPKLVKAGHRVAICEQLEDPKLAKKIVKRGVTEIITPGVNINDKLLDNQSNNFLAAISFTNNLLGVSFLDISTGEFYAAEGEADYVDKLLQSFQPCEVLIARGKKTTMEELFGKKWCWFVLEDWIFESKFTKDTLLRHFETSNLKGFGIEEWEMATIAAGVCMYYINETQQHQRQQQIRTLSRIDESRYVWLDRFTIRNLELITPLQENGRSLLDAINVTQTNMGARLLKKWIVLPLKDVKAIQERQHVVQFFYENIDIAAAIKAHIHGISDLERLTTKSALGKIQPREILSIQHSLQKIKEIKDLLPDTAILSIQKIKEQLQPCETLIHIISSTLVDNPPALAIKGTIIQDGVHTALDELREISRNGKEYLEKILQKEITATGITSLKIGMNNVFGYYLEVTNTHKDKAPTHWLRKQTLANAERYITEELKEYEEKILGAEEKMLVLEMQIFNELIQSINTYIPSLQQNASNVARLDVLVSFSTIALKEKYVCPEVDMSLDIDIKAGRHPVIEQYLSIDSPYIPNDIWLDTTTEQIRMITGPNMSGKSALLRQTALIVLMAQIGSFVPAKSARIGIIDKVFTRVGASDNISSGESTFMVEMNETASIMNNLSDRSLVLLDEIGRGTSTYDGISIAYAIAHYIHEHTYKAKTLFATHYHELNAMEATLDRIKNYHVSVKEIQNKIVFLRTLQPGGSEHSFGIHVAKMAGMPLSILLKANEILHDLEAHRDAQPDTIQQIFNKDTLQYNIFEVATDSRLLKVEKCLESIDINNLTPIDALFKLQELKKLMQ